MSLNKEPTNTHEAQQLALAMQEYIEASFAERSAREKFEGHSWDYHGHRLILERDKSADVFTEKLNNYVDSRICLALADIRKNLASKYPS